MNFFKKLFGTTDTDNLQTVAKKKRVTSLLDLLQLDIRKIPDKTFTKSSPDIDSVDDDFMTYRRKLDYKECGIFDFVEVLLFPSMNTNVIFSSPDVSNISIPHVKELIDTLFVLYGPDDSGQQGFTALDAKFIQSGFWTGRLYGINEEKQRPGIIISMYGENIKMTLHSARYFKR